MKADDFQTTRDCHVCSGTGRLYDDAEVGAALRAEREGAGIGLRRLAKLIGWSPAYLSKLETGAQQWNAGRIALFLSTLRGVRNETRMGRLPATGNGSRPGRIL